MRVIQVDQDTDEWIQLRKSKITGSKLKDLYSPRGDRKDAFYQLLADRLALVDESGDGSDRDRGHEKEVEAIEMFMAETGKVVDTKPGMWIADFNENIAISPDGAILSSGAFAMKKDAGVFKKGQIMGYDGIKKYIEAVEVKCLAAKNHLRAVIEDKIPKDFHLQVIQYFLVNEDLQVLHFVFYDDRITTHPFHMIDVTRDEVEEEVERMKEWEVKTLKEIDKLAEKFF